MTGIILFHPKNKVSRPGNVDRKLRIRRGERDVVSLDFGAGIYLFSEVLLVIRKWEGRGEPSGICSFCRKLPKARSFILFTYHRTVAIARPHRKHPSTAGSFPRVQLRVYPAFRRGNHGHPSSPNVEGLSKLISR